MKFLLKRKILNVCATFIRSVHLEWSPNVKLSKKLWDRYSKLPIQDCKLQVTYLWIDGTDQNLRSKIRTLELSPSSPEECPNWDFNGGSTHFTDLRASEVLLCPVALYNDPILQSGSKIVLCETYNDGGKPSKTNFRHHCLGALNKVCNKDPMFGFEQEFQMMDVDNRPFGWPKLLGEFSPFGSYYCSVGADKAYGRAIVECFYRCCLNCGVDIFGINAEGSPSQWEFQIGPSIGIKAGDDLWVARYLLQRIAEDFGVVISFHPKLFPNWKGAGLLTNFSTKQMRDDGGYKEIEDAIKKLEKTHADHMKVYDTNCGVDNKLRLDGKDGASLFDKFTSGIGDRTASVRINKQVAQHRRGYFEDRRPAANADPYRVIQALVETLCLK